MKIAIRADGGSEIGMGHIMRTLVLAKELSKTSEVFYISRFNDYNIDRYKMGIEKVRLNGFKVELISENNILTQLKNFKADMLITDSYDVDEEYFKQTKKIFNKTVYIDDMNLYFFDADFIINQNICGEDFNYKTSKNTKLLCGSKYVMLREEFRNTPRKIINNKVHDIMITVGGADPNHVTEKILEIIKELDYNFHVVIGPSFKKIEKLKLLQSQNRNVTLYYNANMYELMQKCDIAISACGSTLYELSVCGVPTLGVIIADNQQKIAEKMDELKLIKNLGWHHNIDKYKFTNELVDLCKNKQQRCYMSLKQRKAIDGKGAERIASCILSN